ncbi:trypsin alpha-3-like [Schistocerca gregaria]|uniref:trypsin alpha-3-like n=1 Tax=Schistocerca gregaria TaxID=7010 RepID=UPI00211F1F5E|nr:trypsin alpha-3-like [Schistocerca gregaria]
MEGRIQNKPDRNDEACSAAVPGGRCLQRRSIHEAWLAEARPPGPHSGGRRGGHLAVPLADLPGVGGLSLLWRIHHQFHVGAVCSTLFGTGRFRVLLGTSRYRIRGTGGSTFQLASIQVHDEFSWTTGEYDIAVFSISGTFSFGSNIQTINLGTREPAVGTLVTISGWGDVAFSEPSDSQLRAVTTEIVDRATCSATWVGIAEITENMICTGGDGKGACQGDSGGALAVGSTQYGIFSRTFCSMNNVPDVYTNVAALRSWITSTTGV